MGLETTVAETARLIANPCPTKPPWPAPTHGVRNRRRQNRDLRQQMACTAAPRANAIVPVGRCRYAEDDSHSRCDHLLAHSSERPTVSFNMDRLGKDRRADVAAIGSQLLPSRDIPSAR